jgi:ELWxxDGT repeat protein
MVGGRDQLPAALEFDLSGLLEALEDAGAVEKVELALSGTAALEGFLWPREPVVADGLAYFFAGTPQFGYEPWVTDGTAAGTHMIKDIVPGPGDGEPSRLTAVGGRVFFAAYSGQGSRLWTSDGTALGTFPVNDSEVGGITLPDALTAFDGRLFFTAADSNGDRQLYATTGSGAGLGVELITQNSQFAGLEIVRMKAIGETLFLAAYDFSRSEWILFSLNASDPAGTIEAPMRYRDTPSSTADDLLRHAVEMEVSGTAQLVFAAGDPDPRGTAGVELWRSDGSMAGTARVANLNPNPRGNSNPQAMAVRDGELYFLAFDSGALRLRLWKWDGAAAVPTLIDNNPAFQVDRPDPFIEGAAAGEYYFFTIANSSGTTIWSSDGGLAVRLSPQVGRYGIIDGLTPLDGQLAFHVKPPTVLNPEPSQFWISRGTDRTTELLFETGAGDAIYGITPFADGALFVAMGFSTSSDLFFTNLTNEAPSPVLSIGSAPGQLKVSLLDAESDGVVTGADMTGTASRSVTANIATSQAAQQILVDVTGLFVNGQDGLLDQRRRGATLRLESLPVDGLDPLLLNLARPDSVLDVGLQVTWRHGVRADLLDAKGGMLEENVAALDLRNLDAGTYYLRVFNPHRDQQTEDLHFAIEIKPPIQGQFHPLPDNDLIQGNEGEDILVGNRHLDRLFGQSGDDAFVGEAVEIRDLDDDEFARGPNAAERIVNDPPKITDPLVQIGYDESEPIQGRVFVADQTLGRVLADALDVPLLETADGPRFAVPVHVTDLARLVRLDASDERLEDLAQVHNLNPLPPIADLRGLEYASNLVTLNLAHNTVASISLLAPGRDESGAATGLELLRHVGLDGNPLRDISPLGQLRQLRVLTANDTADHAQDGLWAEYFVPEAGESFATMPDLDRLTPVAAQAVAPVSFQYPNMPSFAARYTGQMLIVLGGPYTFYADADNGSCLIIDGQTVVDNGCLHPAPDADGSIYLTPGYHDVRLDYFQDDGSAALKLEYELFPARENPVPVIPRTLVPAGQLTTAGVRDVAALAGNDNLVYASLANNSLRSADALGGLGKLEYLDVSHNEIDAIDGLAGIYVIDDGDWLGGYSETGQRWAHTQRLGDGQTPLDAYGRDYRFQFDDGQAGVAHWSFSGLPDGQYEVYATWHAHEGQASNAHYTIAHGATTDVLVNQRYAPSGTTFAGRPWQAFGEVEADHGTITVSLASDLADGTVVADAVLVRAVASSLAVLQQLDLRGNALDNVAHEVGIAEIGTSLVRFDADDAPLWIRRILPQAPDTTDTFGSHLTVPNVGTYLDTPAETYLYHVVTDDLRVTAVVDGDKLLVRAEPGFVGTAQVTVIAADGPLQSHDFHGRSAAQTFDFVVGQNALYGRKYSDENQDGSQGGSERGLENWTIFVDLDSDGERDPSEPVARTDANGDYALPDTPNGADEMVMEEARSYAVATERPIAKRLPALTADFSQLGSASADGFEAGGDPVPTDPDDSVVQWQVLKYSLSSCVDPGGPGGHSSPYALWFGARETCSYDVRARVLGAADSPVVDLRSKSAAMLTFKYFLHTERELGKDVARVQVSDDRTHFVTVADNQSDGTGGLVDGPGEWRTATIDLNQFAGMTIQVRFSFDTVDGRNNDFPGWHIDDVVVTAAPKVIHALYFGNFLAVDAVGPAQPASEGDTVTLTSNVMVSGPSYLWTVSGGPFTPGPNNDQATFDFTPLTEGVYQVILTVTDDQNATFTDTAQVFVGDVAPVFEHAPGQPGAGPDIEDNPSTPEDESLGEGQAFTRPLAIVDPGDDDWKVTIDYGDNDTDTFTTTARNLDANNPDGLVHHAYSASGTYTVTVTVVGLNDPLDPNSAEGSFTDSFEVEVHSVPPVISFHGGGGGGGSPPGAPSAPQAAAAPSGGAGESNDNSINEGETFSTTIHISDPTGHAQQTFIGTVSWGDGSPAEQFTLTVSGATGSRTLEHVYRDDGQYTVAVTVGDEDGDQATATSSVTVVNVAPTIAAMNGPASLLEGHSGSFSAAATDPGADALTYSWDFGDRSPAAGGAAVQHTFADNGNYTVTLTVTDGDGGTKTSTLNVSVENVVPTITSAAQQTANEGQTLSIADMARITDAGFDNPALGLAESFTFAIDWGDGSAPQTGSVTVDAVGAPGVPTAGSFDGSHTYADNGSYTVTITVADDDGGSSSATLAVTVRNAAPLVTAAADRTIDEGAALSVSDLAIIADAGFKNAARGSDETFTYTISWGDGSPLETGAATVDMVGNASRPTVASLDGTHTYLDDGTFTVTVTVTDDDGGIASDSLTVTVNNVAPQVSVSQPGGPIKKGELLRLDGSFTDPGADRWQVWVDYTGSGQFVSAVRSGRTFGLAHIYAAAGSYPAVVKVRDDEGAEGTAAFSVVVDAAGPPFVANAIPPLTVSEDAPPVAGYADLNQVFDDPDDADPALSYSVAGNTSPGLVSVALGADDRLNLSFMPDQFGTAQITVQAEDPAGNRTTHTFRIRVTSANDAPVLAPIGDKIVDEETLLQFTVTAGDPNDQPPNSVTLSASGLPAGATFAPATGVFAWTPSEAQQGQYIVTFTAGDNGTPNLTDSETVTITVCEVNDPPVLDPIGDKTVDEETLLQFTVVAGDPNDLPPNSVTLSAAGLPTGATFAPAAGLFTWTPGEAQQGQYIVTFTATDDGTPNLADSRAVTITVLGPAWQNPRHPCDVDGDETIAPLDVLTLINAINSGGSRDLEAASPPTPTPPPFLDPTGDGWISPVDVLTVINYINAHGAGPIAKAASGEGGSVARLEPAKAVTLSASGLPTGATFTPATGVFAWTPSEMQGPGSYRVTFTATDDGTPSLSDSQTIVITVREVNVAPTVEADLAAVTVGEGQAATNSGTWSDREGEDNSVTLSASRGTLRQHAGGTWDWSYVPLDGPASGMVTITADDGAGGVSTASFTLTVTNTAPALGLSGPAVVMAGLPYALNLSASDPGTDTISFWTVTWGDGVVQSVPGNPAAVTHLYPSAAQVYTVSATATDEDGTHPAANTQEVRVISANAELLAGVLYIVGTPGADSVTVKAKVSKGVSVLEVKAKFLPGGKGEFPAAAVTALQVALGEGNDTLTISTQVPQPALVFGGGGNDRITVGGGRATVFGGAGNDHLTGGPGDDALFGEAGADTLRGAAGHDLLDGGADNDRLYGDAGDDTLWGGLGSDQLWGGAGNDQLYGGDGDDILKGDAGDDRLWGEAGDDTLWGGSGADELRGGPGTNVLHADEHDTVVEPKSVSSAEPSGLAQNGAREAVDFRLAADRFFYDLAERDGVPVGGLLPM